MASLLSRLIQIWTLRKVRACLPGKPHLTCPLNHNSVIETSYEQVVHGIFRFIPASAWVQLLSSLLRHGNQGQSANVTCPWMCMASEWDRWGLSPNPWFQRLSSPPTLQNFSQQAPAVNASLKSLHFSLLQGHRCLSTCWVSASCLPVRFKTLGAGGAPHSIIALWLCTAPEQSKRSVNTCWKNEISKSCTWFSDFLLTLLASIVKVLPWKNFDGAFFWCDTDWWWWGRTQPSQKHCEGQELKCSGTVWRGLGSGRQSQRGPKPW